MNVPTQSEIVKMIGNSRLAADWLARELISFQKDHEDIWENNCNIDERNYSYLEALTAAFASALGPNIDNLDSFVPMLIDGLISLNAMAYVIGYEAGKGNFNAS